MNKKGVTFFVSLLFMFCTSVVFAQQTTVTGTVLDEFGETVIGVNILEKGTFNGAITDVNGNFSITVSNAQTSVIQFSFVGYSSKEEIVGGRTTIEVKLTPSVVNLDEVVVIGYGTQTRREITGSVTSISSEEFKRGVTRTAADLLQGKVAGLAVISGSGAAGSDPALRLRGVSTLQNDQGPFIVIDGVPGGSLSQVAPEDIESISVLKDASSAAIYGSRSAGGVILITTKRGSGSRTSVSYSGYVAAATLANKPDLMTADDWRAYAKANRKPEDAAVYDRYGANTDWIDEMSRTAISQNHNLSLSGGSSRSNYRASYNYLNNPGVLRDDALERHSFRFQLQQRAINDRLRVSLTGSGTVTSRDVYNGYNIVLAFNMLPVYPVKLPDGTWFDSTEYDQGNPVRNQTYNQNNRQEAEFYGNGELSFTIIEGLDIRASLYKMRRMRDQSQFNDFTTQAGRNEGGWARRDNQRWDKDLMEWLLEYNKSFAGHKINAMAGYSWEENNWSQGQATNRGFVTNSVGSNSLQSGQGLRSGDVYSARNMDRLISFFARVHYSYLERYVVTATLRRDGSSKFGADNKWGLFPSFGVAWGVSQEEFLRGVNWLDDLKLRIGWGTTGNQSGLSPYRTLALYGTNNTYYDNGAWKTAYRISQNPNPKLKWEETTMFNIAIDFGLFNGKLNGTVEWYNKTTKDMLYSYTVPTPPFMYSTMMANVGDMENKGLEVTLNWNVVHTRDFNWTTSLITDHNKNKVTRMSNEEYSTTVRFEGDAWVRGGSGNTTHVVEEGYPLGQFFGWKFLNFDDAGHYVMEDITGDGRISEDDRTYIGVHWPDLTYGWTNTFNYKNWDLMVFLRGNIGSQVLNHPRLAYAQSNYLIGANALNDPLIYELKEVPKYCSLYIEDASHLRLDNLVLGYNFNTRNVNWLDRARVYVAGQNLFVLTNFKGPDPEVDISRNNGLAPGVLDREFYPKARVFSLGVNLVF